MDEEGEKRYDIQFGFNTKSEVYQITLSYLTFAEADDIYKRVKEAINNGLTTIDIEVPQKQETDEYDERLYERKLVVLKDVNYCDLTRNEGEE